MRQVWPARAQARGDLDPVVLAEVNVEEDDADWLPREHVVHLGGVARLEDPVAVQLEVDPAEEAKGSVVVGHENGELSRAVHLGSSLAGLSSEPMERARPDWERHGYATAVADLWERLAPALIRLERIAETPPDEIVADAREELPGAAVQPARARAELAHGIQPPPRAAAGAHRSSSTRSPRPATRPPTSPRPPRTSSTRSWSSSSLPEWRGALFRVRLARLRALESSPLRAPTSRSSGWRPSRRRSSRIAIVATALVIVGALLFTAGAVLAAWPLWAAGLDALRRRVRALPSVTARQAPRRLPRAEAPTRHEGTPRQGLHGTT